MERLSGKRLARAKTLGTLGPQLVLRSNGCQMSLGTVSWLQVKPSVPHTFPMTAPNAFSCGIMQRRWVSRKRINDLKAFIFECFGSQSLSETVNVD